MKITMARIFFFCLMLSIGLYSCGTGEDNAKTEAQREAKSPDLRVDSQVNPSSSYDPGGMNANDIPENGIGDNAIVPSRKLLENIESTRNLATFSSVVKQAGLINMLNGTGPYTVFAPTDSAFKELGDNVLEDLLKPENKQRLADLLNGHVVPGQVAVADLQDGAMLKTIGGQQLKVSRQGNAVTINGAALEEGDGVSSNGVVHKVNKVLQQQQP